MGGLLQHAASAAADFQLNTCVSTRVVSFREINFNEDQTNFKVLPHDVEMSISRLFTIIGDANVRRNMTGLNVASRETMKKAQVLACDNLAGLDQALADVRAESEVLIVSAITDMLLAADDTGTIASSIESVLNSFKSKLISLCINRKNVMVAVAPPLYRNSPSWYQKYTPQIAGLFSAVLSNNVPANFHLLPSFCSQELLPDGAYLTPVSGLHFVLHLFDQTDALTQISSSSQEAQLYHVREFERQHEDRIVFLEQRHGRLDDRFDSKVAADAEFNDYLLNRSEEDYITVIGSKRINGDTPREWQLAAKKQMNEIFKIVLKSLRVHLDYTVSYVGNPLRYRKHGKTVYNVRLQPFDAAQRIRDLFSGFFRKHSPVPLPAVLKGVQLRNKVTLETRVRISILHQLGSKFVETNGSGSSYKVRGYEPRPLLQTFPPSGASDARPRTFTFIEAVSQLPGIFTDEGLMTIHQIIGTRHPGQLQALFVVLRDDDRSRIEELIRQQPKDRARSRPGPVVSNSGGFVSAGFGMDVQSANLSALGSLRMPPPPPPSHPPPLPQPHSSTTVSPQSEHPHRVIDEQVDRDSRRRRSSSSTSDARQKRRRSSSSSSDGRSKRYRESSDDRSRRSTKKRRSSRSTKSKKSRRRTPSSSSSTSSTRSSHRALSRER